MRVPSTTKDVSYGRHTYMFQNSDHLCDIITTETYCKLYKCMYTQKGSLNDSLTQIMRQFQISAPPPPQPYN